jgi:hypothetical protein
MTKAVTVVCSFLLECSDLSVVGNMRSFFWGE